MEFSTPSQGRCPLQCAANGVKTGSGLRVERGRVVGKEGLTIVRDSEWRWIDTEMPIEAALLTDINFSFDLDGC